MTSTPLLEHLLTRRSVRAGDLCAPGPTDEQLEHILTAAVRVPDHGKLAPWQLLVFDKDAQAQLGELFAQRFGEREAQATEKHLAHERARPQRAPLLVAVIATPKRGKIPLWEQELSAGAVCMNLLHAAYSLGFAGQWLTEWPTFDEEITRALCAEEGAKIAGFIYIGTANDTPADRPRPNLNEIVQHWQSA